MATERAPNASDDNARQLHVRNALESNLQAKQHQQRLTAEKAGGYDDGCALFEMLQYHCRLMGDHVACRPVERFFRRCPGRPSVEVTHVVSTDRVGNVYLSDSMKKAMPPAHHWNEL